jgi:hypothetical protein
MSTQLNIDVTKFNKEYFRSVTRTSGEKAIFTDLRLIAKPKDDWDGMVVQVIPKALRQDGLKGPIIGNYRVYADNYRQEKLPQQSQHNAAKSNGYAPQHEDDDIPF